jgi:hypothetical protein
LQALLGCALWGLGKVSEAEPLLVAGFEGLRKSSQEGAAHQNTVMQYAAQSLVKFYEQRKRPGDEEQAQKYRALANGGE